MKAYALLIAVLFCSLNAFSQQNFVEGRIVYALRIGPVAGATGFTEHVGTYTIIIKGANVRKELKMNSGFQNVIIENSNTGAVYSLQSTGGQDYAVQLRQEDILTKIKPYEGFTQKVEEGAMTIAGQTCHKASVRYKDGSTSSLYFADNWLVSSTTLFERFPGIRNLPLSFEYRNDEGITMHFSAEKVEPAPVESSVFRVPPNYKIISNAEYKAIGK